MQAMHSLRDLPRSEFKIEQDIESKKTKRENYINKK